MSKPIVDDLIAAILGLEGVQKSECHRFGTSGQEWCCSAHMNSGFYGGMAYTCAYGGNRLYALTRLFIRLTQLKSAT